MPASEADKVACLIGNDCIENATVLGKFLCVVAAGQLYQIFHITFATSICCSSFDFLFFLFICACFAFASPFLRLRCESSETRGGEANGKMQIVNECILMQELSYMKCNSKPTQRHQATTRATTSCNRLSPESNVSASMPTPLPSCLPRLRVC